MSESRGFEKSDSETEQGSVSLPQDAQVIRPVNREDSAGLCDRGIVEEPCTLESPVVHEGDRMESFPFSIPGESLCNYAPWQFRKMITLCYIF